MRNLFNLFFLLAVMSGCASFSTVPITRQDSNTMSGDSNGTPRWHCKTRPFRGVPMKIRVQTHVDIFIEEHYALWKGEKFETWQQKDIPIKFYSVRPENVFTEQVIITDFKRPGSGVLDLKLEFNDDQYIDKITSSIQDTTITDSAALIGTIITKVGAAGPTFNNFENTAKERWQWKTRTVAFHRFDINAPDYEIQLEDFVNTYLDSCNRCGFIATHDQDAAIPVGAP
jgi:hypothetical protein